MNGNKKSTSKKIILSILILVLVLVSASVMPTKTQAFAPDVVIVNTAKWVWEKIEGVYKKVAANINRTLVNNAVDAFIGNLSYEMANYIAEGAIGGKPLFRTDPLGKAIQKSGDAAVGQFITDLSNTGFKDLGLNLCDPSLNVKLTLSLNLIDAKAPQQPKCEWRDIQKNWQQFSDDLSGGAWTDAIKFQLDPSKSGAKGIDDFFQSFTLSNSDLGALAVLYDAQEEKIKEAKRIKELHELTCQGYEEKVTKIIEQVEVTCQNNKVIAETPIKEAASTDRAKLLTEKEGGGTVVNIGDVLSDAFGIFTKTLSGKLMQHYIKRGMWSLGNLLGGDDDNGDLRSDLMDKLRGGTDLTQAERSQDVFRDLKTITINEVENYNLLENFAICPAQEDFRHPDNCTIKTGFLQALAQKKTVTQAIEEGLLDGNLPFIGPGDPRNNSDNCYLEGLCYHNLVKLRKANIIPVGWEMVAQRAPIGTSATFAKAMDCFEDETCIYNTSPAYNNHNPFYHLIDPSWVLKAPPVRCNALVYGPTLESSESSARQEYCADVQTCLQEDDDGNCLDGQYGYCARSENTWRFDADICEDGDLYSGCLTFSNEETGKTSYIEGSLDYCTADQVGCKRYASNQDADGNWLMEGDMTLAPATNPLNATDLFLNDRASLCPEDKAGCREFIVMAASRGINLLANGNFDYYQGTADDGSADTINGWSGANLQIISNASNGQNAVKVSGSLSISFDTGIPLKGRTFVLSLQDQSSSAANVELSLNGGGESNSNSQAVSATWQRHQVSIRFTDAVEDTEIAIAISGYANIDEVKLEEVDSYEFARKIDATVGDFSDYGDGGRILMNDNRNMCVAEEVGCQGFIPTNGDPMIPGIVTANDLCPAECVGYTTFAEQPDIFDIMEDPLVTPSYYNFIAGTADSCPAQSVGCEEFTNLDELAAGGESKEYYSYLRQCVPSGLGTTYFTWEGTDVAGYQIKTWTFLKSNLIDGAPCTNVDVDNNNICADTAATVAVCGSETPLDPFDDPIFEPNCREFFDANDVAHFRLQDRVIYASDDCHPYRRTLTNQEYQAIPSLSDSCQASYAGCRSYTGNDANNLRRVFLDNFENGTYSPWQSDTGGSSLDLSNDSLSNNGHSMKVANMGVISRPINGIQDNKSYNITWWMKNSGTVNSVQVSMISSNPEVVIGELPSVASSGDWHRYEITSDSLVNLSGAVTLRMTFTGSGTIFIDNILLKELTNSLPLIKNSWSTPASCDDPFVGAYLGCQAYVNTNNTRYNLKSFTSLCREGAIGCRAVVDTQNSSNPFTETFNAGDFSEITVPEDAVDYLVPDADKYCAEVYKGCSALGDPAVDRINDEILGFNTVYKVNNPDSYASSLCQSANLYCQANNSDKGVYYFKDPGNKTCAYQEDVNIGGAVRSGWFITDTLSSDTPQGCDPNYELATGWAGSCPAGKNLCTTFIDPGDGCDVDNTNPDPDIADCQRYYYYDNSKIDEYSCSGQVDRNNGCILLYDTNEWNAQHTEVITRYDTRQTYANNVAANGPVDPAIFSSDPANPTNLDTNKLVKVKKDRQCAEWLTCKSFSAVWNDETSQYVMICDALDSCIEYSPTSNITQCRDWGTYDDSPLPLTIERYQARVTGPEGHIQWTDKEYVGYSVPFMFPLRDLVVYDMSLDPEVVEPRLVFDSFGYDPGNTCSADDNGDSCTITIEGNPYGGICKDQVCWLNPNGSEEIFQSPLTLTTRGHAEASSPFVKSIKEDDGVKVKNQAYNQAKICLDGDDGCEAVYSKVTYGLGGFVNYFKEDNYGTAGVCSIATGDVKEGASCISDVACGSLSSPGRCDKITKIEDFINWSGICLEPDLSNRVPADNDANNYYCNQWYPVEQVIGAQSRFNHYTSAGFYNPANLDVNMCTVTGAYTTEEDRYYCVGSADGYCSILAMVPSGSQINLNKVGSLSSFVMAGYLNAGQYVPETIPPASIISTLNAGSGNCDLGENSENTAVNNFDECHYSSSMFSASNFVGGTSGGSLPVMSKTEIHDLFDPPTSIRYFVYDEEVSLDGSTNDDASILAPGSVKYELKVCSSPMNVPLCGVNQHQVFANRDLASPKCYVGGPRHSRGRRYCNPESHNYYINLGDYSLTQTVCEDQDCSASLGKGRSCLNSNGYYSGIIATSTPCTLEAEKADYPQKCFKKCINDLSVSDPTACSEYGEVELDSNDNVIDISACLDNLYHSSAGVLETRAGVSSGLIDVVSGYDTIVDDPWHPGEDMTVGVPGCLDSEVGLNCSTVTLSIPQGLWDCEFIPLPLYHYICHGGSTVSWQDSGINCTGLACYQQCQTISTINAEGNSNDSSWVRTDIWWRAKNGSLHLPTPATSWRSYYYNSGSYVHNANVLFNTIGGTGIHDFFGADQGGPEQKIVTQVPPANTYSVALGNRQAATFFSGTDLPTAEAQMRYLFAELYNLTWDGAVYTHSSDSSIETVDPNTFAGPDHGPRILQVCGNDVCPDGALGITVNNQNDSTIEIIGDDGVLFSAVKFYYYAHPDHMPLTEVSLDWGDGSESSGLVADSKYKNNLPECDPLASSPYDKKTLGFGGTAGACHEGYKSFFYFYTYDETPNSPHRCSAQIDLGAPDYSNADCYRPTVTVKDNWDNVKTETYDGWLVVYEPED